MCTTLLSTLLLLHRAEQRWVCCRVGDIDEVDQVLCTALPPGLEGFISSSRQKENLHTHLSKQAGATDVIFIPSECLNRSEHPDQSEWRVKMQKTLHRRSKCPLTGIIWHLLKVCIWMSREDSSRPNHLYVFIKTEQWDEGRLNIHPCCASTFTAGMCACSSSLGIM